MAPPGAAGILDASWIAPTTNADGTPLTDLAFYRIYYGTSGAPCPGGTFLQIASPTSSPAPGDIVSVRLTGLSTAMLYTISVSAVDLSGDESACSTPANGVARIDVAVSPTGTVNFGNVSVGSTADQVFTVSNTAGGTVSGTVSTSAPFSIISGSPFSLLGLGTTQAVTVRFTPSSQATATVSISFAADGDIISRLATGTGIAADATPPSIAITTPAFGPTYSTSLTLAGTASDNIGVTQVTWVNNRGSGGTATGTTSWTAGRIPLQLGTNVISVTAQDLAGNTATASFTVRRITLTFSDDPLVAQSSTVKAVHVTELRTVIDSLRAARGLSTFAWTDPALVSASTPIRAVHVTELRAALNEAYLAAGQPLPTFSDPAVAAGVTLINANHLTELRTAAFALN